jgi:hypothetical protein
MAFPFCLVSAQVKSTDPDNHAVYVQFLQQGNESPVLPARVLTHGPMDGLRITQQALPGRGTVGLVCAVNGDPRSLVWMGAIAANGQDAITTGPGNDFFEYKSTFSGYYEYQDEGGNTAMQWPDNTLVTVGVSGAPQLFYHRIDSTGKRARMPVPRSAQVANPPSPMPINVNHSSGTKITIDGSGNVTVSGASNIILTTPNGNVDIGNIVNTVYRLVDERMVALYNNHIHTNVTNGTGETGPPATPMAVGSETTLVTFAN